MNDLRLRLSMLEAKHGKERAETREKPLRVFYGWAKTGKIRKKEAISVIFENESMRDERTMRAIAKYQQTVHIRRQTPDERRDAANSTRCFSEYSVFLSDRRIKGSLRRALLENMEADRKNVGERELSEIADKLREAYLAEHPDYKEPVSQLDLFTD